MKHKIAVISLLFSLTLSVTISGMHGDLNDILRRLQYSSHGGRQPYGDETDLSKLATRAMREGAGQAILDTTRTTLANSIAFVPSLITRFGMMWGAFFYKLFYGSRGLSSASLQLTSEEIWRVVNPYAVKTYATTDRVKRMTEINQEMNNEVRDAHWDRMQQKIRRTIEAAQASLHVALPCYNSSFAQQKGMRALLASCMQTFSSHDNEQISRLIIATHGDLDTLKEYITSFKSHKEVEQNNDHIKKWLNIILGDFQQLGALVDGLGATSGTGLTKTPFRTMAGGGQVASNQIAELLNAAAQ